MGSKNSNFKSESLHLTQPVISEGTCFSKKEIWDATTQTYSKIGNATQIYKLKHQIHGTLSVNGL